MKSNEAANWTLADVKRPELPPGWSTSVNFGRPYSFRGLGGVASVWCSAETVGRGGDVLLRAYFSARHSARQSPAFRRFHGRMGRRLLELGYRRHAEESFRSLGEWWPGIFVKTLRRGAHVAEECAALHGLMAKAAARTGRATSAA